jgi:hypothetical protein
LAHLRGIALGAVEAERRARRGWRCRPLIPFNETGVKQVTNVRSGLSDAPTFTLRSSLRNAVRARFLVPFTLLAHVPELTAALKLWAQVRWLGANAHSRFSTSTAGAASAGGERSSDQQGGSCYAAALSGLYAHRSGSTQVNARAESP